MCLIFGTSLLRAGVGHISPASGRQVGMSCSGSCTPMGIWSDGGL